MKGQGKGSGSPASAKAEVGERPGSGVEPNAAQRATKGSGGVTGKGFKPGQSDNPGGVSKEKRAFLERLTTDDADEVYAAFMGLVREGNPPAVLRAVEYLAGKPPNAKADNDAIAQGLTVVVHSLAPKTESSE